MSWPWLHSGASPLLCITAELWWCFWGACPQTNPSPVGPCGHVWFRASVRCGGCACLAPRSRLAQQERRHHVTTQMVAAASHPGMGMGKGIAGTSISKCPKQPLPGSAQSLLPGNPTNTSLLSDERGQLRFLSCNISN